MKAPQTYICMSPSIKDSTHRTRTLSGFRSDVAMMNCFGKEIGYRRGRIVATAWVFMLAVIRAEAQLCLATITGQERA